MKSRSYRRGWKNRSQLNLPLLPYHLQPNKSCWFVKKKTHVFVRTFVVKRQLMRFYSHFSIISRKQRLRSKKRSIVSEMKTSGYKRRKTVYRHIILNLSLQSNLSMYIYLLPSDIAFTSRPELPNWKNNMPRVAHYVIVTKSSWRWNPNSKKKESRRSQLLKEKGVMMIWSRLWKA